VQRTAEPAAPTTTAPASGPRVPGPLPTDSLLHDPCSILTEAEAAQVGLAYPGRPVNETSASCSFRSSGNPLNSISIGAVPQNPHGISDIYDQKARSAYFEPVSIRGYPGALADIHDGRTSGNCQLWVGVTDELAVSIIPQISAGPNKNDPCGLAQKFAAAMIGHLKAQSGRS
jgi:hypothetical protein